MGKNIVIVYTSSIGIPPYVNDSLSHLLANTSADIHFISDKKWESSVLEDDRVFFAGIESLNIQGVFPDFLISKYGDFKDEFYSRTSSRFLYISEYAKKVDLSDFWHIEADNLLFGFDDFSNFDQSDLTEEIGLIKDCEERCVPSVIWFKNNKAAEALASFVYSNNNLEDMKALSLYYDFFKNDKVFLLPLFPPSNLDSESLSFSEHFERFGGSVFDGAALGQYLFGIDLFDEELSIKTVGFINESCKVPYSFSKICFERSVPYLHNEVRVNNLHIHSKNIKWSLRKIQNLSS